MLDYKAAAARSAVRKRGLIERWIGFISARCSPNDCGPSSVLEDDEPQWFSDCPLWTGGKQRVCLPFEIKEKDENLHTLFAQNKVELFEAAAASQTALNGAAAL